MWSAIKGGMGLGMKEMGRAEFFWWGVTSKEGRASKFWALVGRALPDPPIKKHPEECSWSEYCNNFEKSVCESTFSFKATNLQHVRLEMEKRWQNV